MFFELIAAVFAAVAAGGVVAGINHLTGGRLPRWLVPVAAGGALFAFAIAMEYAWFSRTSARFPEGVVVTDTHESSAPWRPWTYAFPMTDRFVAVETGAIRTNDAVPHQRMADVMLFARWQPPQTVPTVFDCAARRAAPLLDDITFDASGAVENADWAPVAGNDATFSTVCEEN